MATRIITLPTRIVEFDEATQTLSASLLSGDPTMKLNGAFAVSIALYLDTALTRHGEMAGDYLIFGVEQGLVQSRISGVEIEHLQPPLAN
jgi:hypothetical protein